MTTTYRLLTSFSYENSSFFYKLGAYAIASLLYFKLLSVFGRIRTPVDLVLCVVKIPNYCVIAIRN